MNLGKAENFQQPKKTNGEKVIGKARFNKDITNELVKEINLNQKYRMLRKGDWSFSPFNDFVGKKWNEMFPYIIELTIDKLILLCIQYQSLLSSLAFPCYTCLIDLGLHSCNISSIEGLVFIKMELLQKLSLSSSYCSLMKPLKKGNWPGLNQIRIYENKRSTICFQRVRFNERALHICVVNQKDFFITKMAKVQFMNIDKIQLDPLKKRLFNEKNSIRSIKEKYHKVFFMIGPNK